jgi:uncharacterized RDD family membrane protein YckC
MSSLRFAVAGILAVLAIVGGLVLVTFLGDKLQAAQEKGRASSAAREVLGSRLQYGGFWRRIAALCLDLLFLSPLGVLTLWLSSDYRLFGIIYFIPGLVISVLYNVVLVKLYGGTPGKIAAGLRITKIDGSPVGYREAILRHLPDLLLGSMISVGILSSDLRISDHDYIGLGLVERSRLELSLAPAWLSPVEILQRVWTWGEFLVLLTNEKRRAIHDFIAGTVVLLREPHPMASLTSANP